VSLREDPLHRGASIMVILPKDRFSGDVRKALESALIDTFQGEVLNYHLALGAGDQARLHFYMATRPDKLRAARLEDLEQMVGHIIRSWADRVRDGLERVRPADDARRLAQRYGRDFSPEYQAATDPSVAVGDILELESMAADDRDISIGFADRGRTVAAPGEEGVTELKVYVRGERLVLSDFMPILENTGLRVLAVVPFDVGGGGPGLATIYAFAVHDGAARPLEIEGRRELLAEAILAVRCGDALNDSLNKLVLGAGLHWREVDVLRAYSGYAFQAGAVPSRLALPNALVKYPGIAAELFELFAARFDPSAGADVEDRNDVAEDIRSAFFGSLGGVSALADDRALRRMQMLISGTLRTNFYRRGGRAPTFRSGGVPYVSFKFSSANIEFLRQTRLRYEVWVHSARMEGVHLRGARVARGGIRWSDRPDDFRTEILGLVKTQVVKNAVIVPGGSKGGFVVRLNIEDPDARFAEARDQYRTLVRGLLDLTDNLEPSGATLPPPDVVCFDEPDPYLVVAADKGTATFSDVANGISGEYGFWLSDAFASGGSNGYDHKAVGITARGAWECVKRHFREKGKNIQEEPFTVVGVGDMSGDVFGNGMLLSRQIRLIAAFDHRHIFIDPDPEPAPTYAERERVFALGRSSWADYDESLLSEGGMIVPRGSKEVELTPRARAALGIPEDAPAVLDGEALIRAVLCAPAELLWNGGIGTYVKSSTETHADAGDPSNDAVRVNTEDLRCEVLGEGGNLGFTQRARIEFALRGGRVNTDAMDNSGGVDMSDHEVNLKILLTPAVAEGRMSAERRNELLEELTEEVAHLVLEDNRTQSLGISLDGLRAHESSDEFRDLMVALEKAGELNRAGEGLPSTDVLVERAERGQTLARPELCVLLAYAKLSLKTSLLRGALTEDPVTGGYLHDYFPKRAVESAGEDALQGHRLRREIIAGQVTNDLVDLMGATFVNRVARDTGRSAEEVVRAWLVASRLADHRALLDEMAKQQSAMNAEVSYRWLLGLSRVLERSTRWVLQNVDADASPAKIVDDNATGLAALRAGFAGLVAGEDRALFRERVREIQALGADASFSETLITLRFLDQLLEILRIARDTAADTMETGRAYYALAESLDIPWLRRITLTSASAGPWERRAARALGQDLSRVHRRLVVTAVERSRSGDVAAAAAAMLKGAGRELERYRGVVAELRAEESADLSGASVAVRELGELSERVAGPGVPA
ncbi:MAG TPA: NAD-glutamate dehydrogenase domain-containing protein, partial [Longimicrobiales bacterium]|nr:NAD-glutamate dehydrogenase domain-containing protein [Longimicrobiales bacterium]